MAVYTDISDEALEGFLLDYDLGGLVSYRGIAEGVENSNFALRTTAGDFILTLYEKRVIPAELPWFLGLMDHLAARGIDCPRPVRGRDGQALRSLADRPAAITTFLPGVWPRRIRQPHCSRLGEALARLHMAGEGYAATRTNGMGPAAWGTLWHSCATGADAVQPGLRAALDAAVPALTAAWPIGLPVGHIHADLFPDNVFFLDGTISGVIDFLFAATDYLAYDLAICLNAWCFEGDGQLNATRARALVQGYEAVRPLTAAERHAMPVLCAGAALRFLLTRLYDWTNTPADAMVVRKDPLEYWRKLRLHQGIERWEQYGI